MNTNNFKISEHFSLFEFECPCCKRVVVNKELVKKLEELRRRTGVPMRITSGYRCANFNSKVAGHPFSLHTQGRAVDIDGTDRRKIEQHRQEIFASGYYNKSGNYFHLQLDPAKEW